MNDLQIVHEPELQRFTATLDGFTATLDYRPVGATVLDYTRTFVPTDIRRRGVALKLTMHALEYAAANDFKVIPSCWFVAKVMRENSVFSTLETDV